MVIILMGVSGAGKTTVGKLLAEDLGWQFIEGDDLHPAANVAKMAQGIALNDEDRAPWLDAVRALTLELVQRGEPAIVTCSALKQAYRDHISRGSQDVCFVYLRGDYDLIRGRLEQRKGHFVTADLLESQFRTLEEPEASVVIDVRQSPRDVVRQIKKAISLL